MHDVIRLHSDAVSAPPANTKHTHKCVCACAHMVVHKIKRERHVFTLPSDEPPSHHHHPCNFQTSISAEFSSCVLTVDCKCPNLGRQPFLITRITLLSNRKIKLNNTIAYSRSQTAAPRNASISSRAAPPRFPTLPPYRW